MAKPAVAAQTEEQRLEAAEAKLKEALQDFFGDEKTIIVENTQPGGVSIGFGKVGQEAGALGYLIPRSRLPQVLTEKFPAEYWRDSPDFRQALAKRWIKFVTPEAYALAVAAEKAHEARLNALAANEKPKQVAFDAEINPLQQNVINPETAQVEPSLAQAVAEYEQRLNAPTATPVLKDGRSARAESLVERIRRGTVTSLDALKELDADAPLYTEADLDFIARNAEFTGVRSFAQTLLSGRVSA